MRASSEMGTYRAGAVIDVTVNQHFTLTCQNGIARNVLSIGGICAVLFQLTLALLPFKMWYIILGHPVLLKSPRRIVFDFGLDDRR